MPVWLYLVILGACTILGFSVFQIVSALQDSEREALRNRLAALGRSSTTDGPESYLRGGRPSHAPWLKLILFRKSWNDTLWWMLRQANLDISLGSFVLVSVLLALLGGGAARLLGWGIILQVVLFIAFLLVPIGWVRIKIRKRLTLFEEQLPEALDLIGRSLKAGHTFTSGMTLVSQEFADPIREEFRLTIEEINFGGHINDALDSLAERVPSPDVVFFVAAVKIQSETGGKLTEIMDSISYLIRERAKLKGKVAALSAEGRYSGLVMFLLPPVMMGVIKFLNPKYMAVLFDTTAGNYILYASGTMLAIGILVIQRMVNIRV
ncbi:type II secretion system F family protein [Fundidesulfovibrio terrae]|uniref:type II secretion system F family protein n=1 Tax=Fundidesulfovibrio terrae TaxID=2922866 RepID=UPI001FAFE8C4|nr:type II secretion system F family protein [Fundidesulfovibrio terrae]